MMLERFIGKKHFKTGIQEYIANHTYGHAVTANLWRIMETVPEKKLLIGRIMDTWTRQMGFPVLTVEKVEVDTYKLSQKRFLRNQVKAREHQDTSRWSIPVTWICSSKPRSILTELMDQERFRNILFNG